MIENRSVYADHAATTALRREVLEAMMPYLTQEYGNASSVYTRGQKARFAVEKARRTLAGVIGAHSKEIIFTSGGSEADNWALLGSAKALSAKGRHIITTQIEHHAVLRTLQALEKEGFEVTYLPVDQNGLVTPEQIEAALRSDTILVSIMTVNNEIGTIEPIDRIGRLLREKGVRFHTDAVQAFGKLPLDVSQLQIDLMSMSAHKLGGPQGVGALYIREGCELAPLILGGQQEFSRRAGTENVPGIVGFAKASELAQQEMNETDAYVRELQMMLINGLKQTVPNCVFHQPNNGISGIVNVSLLGTEAESMLILLDMKGISVSAGSACMAGSIEPSHVLQAIGLDRSEAAAAIRISLGRDNTKEDVDYLIIKIAETTRHIRTMRSDFGNR